MKTSAIDYLIEYINLKNEDEWIQSVVSCYLHSNGEISDLEIENLTNSLLTNNIKEYALDTFKPISNTSNLIKINKLEHESGVNALADNQEIVFNNQVTVLYGRNGSGKSSYFRIVQSMLGNVKNSDLIPNIYLDNPKNINVNLEYSINKNVYSVNWCNNEEISDLKSIKVFDSKYSKKFLEKRESDEQILYPYKLYMFSEISDYIDQIKKKAKEKLDARAKENIPPTLDYLIEEETNKFKREKTKEDKEYFISVSENFNEAKEKELLKKKDEINSLLETNYSDKLKILNIKIKRYNDVKERVENTLFLWLDKSIEYHNEIALYKKYKADSDRNRKHIDNLSNLPGTESSEWKEFINKGILISKNSEELIDTCPYCHRKYDERALLIVEAYSVFIQDETEVKLSECKSKIEDIMNEAKHTKIIEEDYLVEDSEGLQTQVLSLFNKVSDYLESLDKVGNSIENIEPIMCDKRLIISEFNDLKETYNNEKKNIIEESSKKKDNLIKLKEEKSKLMYEKDIHDKIDSITEFIDEEIEILELKQRVNTISSHKISTLSKTAHENLLSDKLVEKFNEFLEKLKISGHRIELKNTNIKGGQQTELVMMSKTNVTKILSEGEQKGVSLALFLAEIFVSRNKSTIILDDPVNSLDHKMMEYLSDILLQLDNQVIIFTHNRMFLDAISGSDHGHLCKNFNTNGCSKKKGKHIFIYQIKSEGINYKGVIVSRINDNAKGYLSDAHELLRESPFNEELKVCALLRNAIDHIIDEVIFNGQIPRKYSIKGVGQSIQWEKLKKMGYKPERIDDLKRIYGRVSAGELHLGQVSSNNPPDKEELLQLHKELCAISSLNLEL